MDSGTIMFTKKIQPHFLMNLNFLQGTQHFLKSIFKDSILCDSNLSYT